MLTFSRKPLGIWLVSAFVLGASLLVSLLASHTAFAATGLWKNSTTITVAGVDYVSKGTSFLVQCTTSTASNFQVFAPASGAGRVFFNPGDNLDSVTAGKFSAGGKFGGTCEETLTLSNTRATAGTGAGTGTGTGTSPTPTPDAAETCNLPNVGWIVCPASTMLAKVTDGAFALVENLLVFEVGANPFDTSTANPVYTIWSNVRNLANIAFIFAFFAIILSQATSIGLGSYGIKKMLPRLIVAAILVNLSYFICVFAVDISNILGAGLDGIIKSVPVSGGGGTSSDPATGVGTWTSVIGAVLATGFVAGAVSGATVWGALAAALPFLVIALFAILTALVILIARQAILILLIILAPLAFVAYILPNTEDLFGKWRKLFTTMLVFYPLVVIVFAGSQVAASILRITANGGGFDDQLVKVMSLAVQAFPLFALPFILKFSGGVLGRIGGMVNNPNKGPFDSLRKRAEQRRDTSIARGQKRAAERKRPDYRYDADGNKRKLGKTRTFMANSNPFSSRAVNQGRIDRERDLEEAKGARSRAEGTYYAGRVSSDEGYADRMAGGGWKREADLADKMRVTTAAKAAERNAFNERVKAYQTSFSLIPEGSETGDGKYLERQFNEAIANSNAEQASAVLNRMSNLGAGGREAVARVMSRVQLSPDDADMKLTLSNSIYEDNYGSLVGKVGDTAKGKWAEENGRLKWKSSGSLANVGTEQLATQDFATITRNTAFDDQGKVIQSVIDPAEAKRIVEDVELSSKVQDTQTLNLFKEIAQLPPRTPASASTTGTPPSTPSPATPGGTGGGGSSGGGGNTASTAAAAAAAAAAGAAAGAAAASAAGGGNTQQGPGMFDAYSTQQIQQLSPDAIRSYMSNGGGVTKLDDRDVDKLRDALGSQGTRTQDQEVLFQQVNNEYANRSNQAYNTYTENVTAGQRIDQDRAYESYEGNLKVSRDNELDQTRNAIRDLDSKIGLGQPPANPPRPRRGGGNQGNNTP